MDAINAILEGIPEPPADRTAGSFRLTDFQRSGVRFARSALASRGLAIIADDVGTGKSIMALRLIDEALEEGRHVFLAVPASLRPTWIALLGEERMARLTLRSHTWLAVHGSACLPARSLVVVDEAHAFRNPVTRRHAALARTAALSRVLLLTATPVNNSLLDLYFLLRLRLPDGAFADLGVGDLGAAFRDAARTRRIDGTLGRALDQVLLRRPRSPRDLHAEGLSEDSGANRQAMVRQRFPERRLHAVPYPAGEGSPFAAILDDLAGRRLTAYDPAGSSGVGDLVRLVLLKRIESGVAAFQASLDRVLGFHRRFLDALACGRLVTARMRPGDTAQLELPLLVGLPLPPELDPDRLAAGVRADLAALAGIREALSGMPDPKLTRLRTLLDERARHQVLVFTEFRETARAIHASLRGRPGLARIDGTGAWLGSAGAGRAAVVRRFAPRANGARPPPEREAVSVLIATDVLSEGLNLQDADTVVNYDLPWNPVRLIQRMGRIDRLGSPHEAIDVFHFLPDRHLDRWIALVATLSRKVESIGAAMGGVRPVLPLTRPPERRRGTSRSAAAAIRDLACEIFSQVPVGRAVTDSVRTPQTGVPVYIGSGGPSGILLAVADPDVAFRLVRNGEIELPDPAEVVGWLRTAALATPDGSVPPSSLPIGDLDLAAGMLVRRAIAPGSAAARAARRVLSLAAIGDSDLAQGLIEALERLAPGRDDLIGAWADGADGLEDLAGLLDGGECFRPRVLAAFVLG